MCVSLLYYLIEFEIDFRDPSILAECGLDENTQNVLLNNIKRKLTSQAVKIRADIEVACYGYEGIDAVKTALKAGLACSTEELPIKINLIAPPLYGNLNFYNIYLMMQFSVLNMNKSATDLKRVLV